VTSRLILACALASVALAQTTVKVQVGALTCYALRRQVINGSQNVQTYCFAGTPVVTNHSDLIKPGAAVLAVHTYGSDVVVWRFSDLGGGAISYEVQVSDSGPSKSGNLP